MTRVFIDQELGLDESVIITGEDAHYLLRVVRVQPGEGLTVVDTVGRAYEVVVAACTPLQVEARVVAALETGADPALQLSLYAAILKGKHFDWVLQKGTELGVSRFVPIVTERTIARPPKDRIEDRLERWRKIVSEACRQCGRSRPPEVTAPLDWSQAVADWHSRGEPGLLPYEALAGEGTADLKPMLRGLSHPGRVSVFVGPEGGFSLREVETARAEGLTCVSLGPRILRAETASMYAAAVVLYELTR